MAVEAVIFDLDGTLLDTSEGIFKTANTVIRMMGGSECHDLDRFSLFVGPPLHVGFEKVFGLAGSENREAVATYKKLYKDIGISRYSYYPGLVDAVKSMKEKGLKLGVATLKNEEAAEMMISSSLFDGLFDVIRGSDEAETLTKAMIIKKVCSFFSVPYSKSVLVGDSESDERGAMEAGVQFIPVGWGFGFPDRDKNDASFLSNPCQLYDRIILQGEFK